MTDLSAVPLFLLCREARRDVTVCMSGVGGDEVFIGYDRFVASKADRLYRLLPRAFRRGVIEPVSIKGSPPRYRRADVERLVERGTS